MIKINLIHLINLLKIKKLFLVIHPHIQINFLIKHIILVNNLQIVYQALSQLMKVSNKIKKLFKNLKKKNKYIKEKNLLKIIEIIMYGTKLDVRHIKF